MLDLSVIVPLHNEEQNVYPLYDALIGALAPLGLRYELLFVDDGSTDATFGQAAELARCDERLRIVKFRGNFGQTPAMAAGIDIARGKILVTMDGDLQNDPRDIPLFLDKIDEGYDLVVGWRINRQDKLITRKIPSRIANWLIGKVTGVPIKDNGCSLKAYRAGVIKAVPLYSEMHRFIPAMASVTGSRIAEIGVRHHARQFGLSKYGLSRVYKVLFDLLVIKTLASFFSRPLLWFVFLGLQAAVVGVVLIGIGVAQVWSGAASSLIPVAGSGLLFLMLTVFLVFGGVLGELVYKTGDVDELTFSRVTVQRSRAGPEPRSSMHTLGPISARPFPK